MQIEKLMEFIKNPNNIYKPPNPVLALRENLGAPKHELNIVKGRRSLHAMAYAGGMHSFRLRGLTPKPINQEFDFSSIIRKMKANSLVVDVQAARNDLTMPSKYKPEDVKHLEANFDYDRIPLMGDYMGIPVKDIMQLSFIVQQEKKSYPYGAIGFNELGSGCYSTVFTHSGNKDIVVKVCWSGDKTKHWLRYAMLNAGKAGLPTVHSIITCGEGYIAFMEKMESHSTGYINDLPEFEFTERIFSGWDKERCFEGYASLTNSERSRYEEIYEVVTAFMRWLPKDAQRYDFHCGNAMISSSNGFCITDPLI